ncbi:MAG: hypothetical protein IJS45_03220 [Clostridia bacterium]|nr:hypothetical protein [Clostridia bacterium]
MKRILSTVIAIVMVVSVMSFVPFTANATGGNGHTLDAHNVGFEVPYFSGKTEYYDITGAIGSMSYEDIGEINGISKSGKSKLILNGEVSEAEWGKPIIEVDSRYAAERGTSTPSPENTYFWWSQKGDNATQIDVTSGTAVHDKGMSYKVWMAWDEEFLYVAAVVVDPDSYNAPKDDKNNIWNGDAIQFIIDPEGPNSVAGGEGYNPAKNPRPWNSYEGKTGQYFNTGLIANIGAGFVTDISNVYDLSRRYSPVLSESAETPTVDWNTNSISYGDYVADDSWVNEIMGTDDDNFAFAAIVPVQTGEGKDAVFTTTYELAIPWTLMNGTHYDYEIVGDEVVTELVQGDLLPEAGKEYGFSMVALNAKRGSTNYNSWLTWGSGVCGAQTDSADFATAGGSNSMLLVADELGTTGCDHTFDDPTCSTPYICTKCGYERGFAVGHDYTSELITPLAANQDGLIRSTCSFCNEVVETIVPAVDQNVQHLFDGTLTEGALDPSSEWNEAGWNTAFHDENGGSIMENGRSKLAYSAYNGEMVFDYSDPAIVGIKVYDGNTDENGKPTYSMPNEQTYFTTSSNYRSYSYKYDFRLAGIAPTEVMKDYRDGIYNWFGGKQPKVITEESPSPYSYGLNYAAGFFPTEPGATTGTFRIMEAAGQVMKDEKATQKILSETEVVDLGTDWHNIIFVFDESACAAFLYVDGECVCAAWDEGMGMNGNDQVAIIRRMDTYCMFKGMGIGSTTAFLDEVEITGYTVTCDGEVIGTYEAGAEVELPVPEFRNVNGNLYRFFTWDGETVTRSSYSNTNETANGRVYTLTMPASNVVLEAVYSLVADVNGDNKVNSKDLAMLKRIVAASEDDVDEAKYDRSDLDCNGKTNSKDISRMKRVVAGDTTAVDR